MPTRLFIAPQVGTGFGGSDTLPPDPYRSLVHNFIDVSQGDWFDEIDIPARLISICCVRASQSRLDAIAADSLITPMLPITCADDAALQSALDAPFSSYPLAWRNAAKAKLEDWGINTGWITGTSTMRQTIKAILKVSYLSQKSLGAQDGNLRQFLLANLDATVGSLPAAVRNAASAWMQSKGLDTSWITGATTVRQVQSFIATNHTVESGLEGKFRFAGGLV